MRAKILLDDFRREIWSDISSEIAKIGYARIEKSHIDIGISFEAIDAIIEVATDKMAIDCLNENFELKEKVGAALKKVYRYTGNFIFDESVFF